MRVIQNNIKRLEKNINTIKGIYDRKKSKMINRYIVLEFSEEKLQKMSPYDQAHTIYGMSRNIYDSAYLISVFRYTRRRYLAYLLKRSIDSIKYEQSAISAFLIRSYIEHSTNFAYQSEKIIESSQEIRKLVSEGVNLNDTKINENKQIIHNLAYSSRLKKNKLGEFLDSDKPTETFIKWIKAGGNPNREKGDIRSGVNAMTPVQKFYKKIPHLEITYDLLCEYIHPNSDPINISTKQKIDITIDENKRLKALNSGSVKYGLMSFQKDIFKDYRSEFFNLYLPPSVEVISECTKFSMSADELLRKEYNLLSQTLKPKIRYVLKGYIKNERYSQIFKKLSSFPCVCDSNKELGKCCGR